MGGIVMDQLVTTFHDQQWLAMVSEQKKSGLTIKAWCSKNGISENCFYYRLIIPGLRPTPAAVQRSLTALQSI